MSTFRLSYFPTFPVNNLEVSKVFFIFAFENNNVEPLKSQMPMG